MLTFSDWIAFALSAGFIILCGLWIAWRAEIVGKLFAEINVEIGRWYMSL